MNRSIRSKSISKVRDFSGSCRARSIFSSASRNFPLRERTQAEKTSPAKSPAGLPRRAAKTFRAGSHFPSPQ